MDKWINTTIGEVIDAIQTGTTPPTSNSIYYKDTTINWFSPSDFDDNRKTLEFSKNKVSDIAVVEGKAKLYPEKTLLLVAIGATIGKVGVLYSQGSSNQQITGLTFKSDIFIDYSYYWFRYIKSIIINVSSSATLPIINQKGIRELPFKYPKSYQEQINIATKLDILFKKTDDSIFLLEENLKHSRSLVLSIIDEEFKKQSLIVKNSTLPQLVKKDKHSIKRGPFGSALKKAFFVPSGYKIYEQKNAIKNDFSIGEYYINEVKFKELEAFEVKSGDIIISCSGTIGKIAIAPDNIEKGIINQALLKITLDSEKILPEYFALFFENFVNQGELESKGAAIKNIVSVAELKQIPIPTPNSISEQKTFLKNIENKRNLLNNYIKETEKKLENIKALKSSLLDQAFKGEL